MNSSCMVMVAAQQHANPWMQGMTGMHFGATYLHAPTGAFCKHAVLCRYQAMGFSIEDARAGMAAGSCCAVHLQLQPH